MRVERAARRVDYVFDDGGMNLLSSDALRRIQVEVLGLSGCQVVEADGITGKDPSVTLFVFRSGRPNLFAAGADMAEMQRFTPWEAYEFATLGQQLFEEIERLPCVTVAVIDGDCFGGALDLVLSFDLRFATPRSRFAHPGARIGIVTGFGGTSRWRKVLSRKAANQLFLANRVLTAAEAYELGLVDRVADSHDEELAQLEHLDVRMVKHLTNVANRLSRAELLLLARRLGEIG